MELSRRSAVPNLELSEGRGGKSVAVSRQSSGCGKSFIDWLYKPSSQAVIAHDRDRGSGRRLDCKKRLHSRHWVIETWEAESEPTHRSFTIKLAKITSVVDGKSKGGQVGQHGRIQLL